MEKNKKMKKFFKINIILSFVLVGSLYGLSWIWINYVDEMSVKFLYIERNKDIRNLKIINVGSSHTTYGIKYPENIKAYNMGLSSQKFYYDFEILKKYYEKLDKNCIVIIPISIFSFYNGADLGDISQNYIQILDREKLIGVDDKKEYFFQKIFPVVQSHKRIRKVINYIMESILKMKFNKNFISYPNNLSFEKKQKKAIETALDHLEINFKNNGYDKKISINQLKNILKFCEERSFRPILITTPQTYLYNEQIGEKNYQERIYNNIREVEREMGKKYLYLDYSHDERFVNNLEYFFDDDHLNEKGAEYFTEILLRDIEKQGYNFN